MSMMSEQTVVPREVAPVTFKERLAAFPEPDVSGQFVVVRQVCDVDAENLIGQVGRLTLVDRSDDWRTFRVQFAGDEPDRWVHRVEPLDLTLLGETPAMSGYDPTSQFEAFKTQVRDTAIRVAEEQGWCDDGLNRVLDELGLDRKTNPRVEVMVTVTTTWRLTGTPNRADPDESWTSASMSLYDGEPALDGDWSDVETDRIEDNFEVTSVEEEE